MDDHVHAICQPFDGHQLEHIVHSWKSFTANQVRSQHGRTGRVWLDEYFDRIVRDEAELWQKLYYVLNNPRKRWPDIEEYEWVGMHRLLEPELGR